MTFSGSRSETRHVEQFGDQRYIKYRQHMFTQVITGRGDRKLDIHQQKQNKITEGINKAPTSNALIRPPLASGVLNHARV